MVVTVPHLGNVYLAAKALFDDLGVQYILPPLNCKESLRIGSQHSPEEMCLPFKLMMGNYISCIEKGADTVVITGSCGPCRFGEYCELQMNILNQMNHVVDFVVLDLSSEVGIDEFIRRISKISNASSLRRARKMQALLKAMKVMDLLDKMEAKAHKLAGYELKSGECKRILRKCKSDAIKSGNSSEMIEIIRDAIDELETLPLDPGKNPLEIAIIGEIYTVIEPFSNLFIEDKLMEYGVSTKRHLTPSWWFKDMVMKPLKLNSMDLRLASREYLPLYIGGHGRECIGEAVSAQRDGIDGAIQIFPLGCHA